MAGMDDAYELINHAEELQKKRKKKTAALEVGGVNEECND